MIDRIRKTIKECLYQIVDNYRHIQQVRNVDIIEAEYFTINEIKIDADLYNIHNYVPSKYNKWSNSDSWEFEDRCGNTIIVIYIKNNSEIKTGYKLENGDVIFNTEKYNDSNLLKIKPCPDDAKLNTIYRIIKTEILPKYLLNKRFSKITFNPISKSRSRIVKMILNKLIEDYPQLEIKDLSLINK